MTDEERQEAKLLFRQMFAISSKDTLASTQQQLEKQSDNSLLVKE